MGICSFGAAQKAQADDEIVYINGFTVFCIDAGALTGTLKENTVATITAFPAEAIITNMPDSADFTFADLNGLGIPDSYIQRIPIAEIHLFDSNNEAIAAWEEIRVPSHIKRWYSTTYLERAVNLHTVSLSASGITKLNNDLFTNCASLQTVSLPATLKEIGVHAFYGCTSLQNITVPASVTTIGQYAFYGCTSLPNITVPASVTTIGEAAFRGCTSLNQVDFLGDSLDIGGMCFFDCTHLQRVNFLPKVKLTLRANTFENCSSLPSINLPEGLETISQSCFDNCTSLANITIPHSVKTIDIWAFRNNISLESVTFSQPDSLSIYLGAFRGCTTLASVDFDNPKALKIGEYSFGDCTGLTSFSLPAGTTYNRTNGNPVFYNCSNLKTLYYNAANMNYGALFGIYANCPVENLYLGSTVETIPNDIFRNFKIKEVTLPESLKEIGYSAFNNCDSLKTITIPASVTKVGDYAFADNASLKEANIQGKLTGTHIFNNCDALEKVIFSETLDSIPSWAFSSADSLKIIDIPQSVTRIGDGAFSYLLYLQQVKVHWQTPIDIVKETENRNAFYYYWPSYREYIGNITLLVPRGTVEAYKAAEVWKDFNIVEDGSDTGIASVEAGELQISVANGALKIANYAGGEVRIFDISGRAVGADLRVCPDNRGACTGAGAHAGAPLRINISTLPAGIYVVQIGNQTAKFIK
jgi:hypothetical protein